jgi:hypothetical protein
MGALLGSTTAGLVWARVVQENPMLKTRIAKFFVVRVNKFMILING